MKLSPTAVLQTDLSGAWIADFDLFPLQDLGSTRLMESDGMNHVCPTLLFFLPPYSKADDQPLRCSARKAVVR